MAALHSCGFWRGASYPNQMENLMAKPPKVSPKTHLTVIVRLELSRVRWIEPLPRSKPWWPVPRTRFVGGR